MKETFNCPSCGVPLQIPDAVNSSILCNFCNSTVVIPEELRNHNFKVIDPMDALSPHPKEKLEIIEALRKNDKIQAIKIYRHLFQTSLFDSKQAIDRLYENMDQYKIQYPSEGMVSNKEMRVTIRIVVMITAAIFGFFFLIVLPIAITLARQFGGLVR